MMSNHLTNGRSLRLLVNIVLFDNPKHELVGPWEPSFNLVLIIIYKRINLPIRHDEKITDISDSILGKGFRQGIVLWKLEDILNDMRKHILGFRTCENHDKVAGIAQKTQSWLEESMRPVLSPFSGRFFLIQLLPTPVLDGVPQLSVPACSA